MITNSYKICIITTNNSKYEFNTNTKDISNYLKFNYKNFFEFNLSNSLISKNIEETFVELQNFLQIKDIKICLFLESPPLGYISFDNLKKLHNDYFLVYFFGDVFAYFHQIYKSYIPFSDLIFVDEVSEISRFKLYGVEAFFTPYAYDENKIKLSIKEHNNFNSEVSFVGRQDRFGRKEYLDKVSEKFNLSLYGNGTNLGPIKQTEMYQLFNKTKVNLNFTGVEKYQHYKYSNQVDQLIKSVKGRCQEIMMCKGFCLTEDAPYIDSIFRDGEELIIFNNEKDLIDKINYYLINEDERVRITNNGFNKASKEFSIKHVWDKNLSLIDSYFLKKKKITNNIDIYHRNNLLIFEEIKQSSKLLLDNFDKRSIKKSFNIFIKLIFKFKFHSFILFLNIFKNVIKKLLLKY